MEYVREHPPAGSEFGGSLAFGDPSILNAISFVWPAVLRARGSLSLEVSEAPLTRESTSLRVIATGTWLKTRAASEAIPAGMRLLRVDVTSSSLRGAHARQRPLTITNRNRIERVASLLNAEPIVQPIAREIPCPLLSSGIVLGLAFYLHPRGRSVAVAHARLGGCGGVELELGAHTEPELESPRLEEFDEALGVKLDLRPVFGSTAKPAQR